MPYDAKNPMPYTVWKPEWDRQREGWNNRYIDDIPMRLKEHPWLDELGNPTEQMFAETGLTMELYQAYYMGQPYYLGKPPEVKPEPEPRKESALPEGQEEIQTAYGQARIVTKGKKIVLLTVDELEALIERGAGKALASYFGQ